MLQMLQKDFQKKEREPYNNPVTEAINQECCILATYHFKERFEFRLFAHFSDVLQTERCLILRCSTWLK